MINDERFSILHAKISECRSIDQIIDTVYFKYRPMVQEYLLLYLSWCEKREMFKTSYERLKTALSSQTVPPHLRVKAPEFQFTKEFGDSDSADASAVHTSFAMATATFQEAINKAALNKAWHTESSCSAYIIC